MTRFLTMLSRAFCNDNLDLMARHFTYPLPMYTKGELLVFGNADTLLEAMTLYREAARAADIQLITPRVVASGLPRKGYSNVWVEWDHFNSAGTLICSSQVRYAVFQDKMALMPRIEMVDYTALGFPEVADALPLMQMA
ncbi:hypothetical protein KUV51_03640 [Tateyamaria omphalii]|uniref:hypothetical protein n=1 Tax=Tateyamaria omphalii TaxID=299262 RepID=UPI001C99B609|nr:hypothetical protein [Tateyamaria omphalii]MBY5932081.1 hypothetical protein [Tateyamaria omphalii]